MSEETPPVEQAEAVGVEVPPAAPESAPVPEIAPAPAADAPSAPPSAPVEASELPPAESASVGDVLRAVGANPAGAAQPPFVRLNPPSAEAATPPIDNAAAMQAIDAVLRGSAQRPVIKERDWCVPFEVSGKAGERKWVSVSPQVLFRGEKIMAEDTFSRPGYGTRIQWLLVGQALQLPAPEDDDNGVLTAFFDRLTLGNGMRLNPCRLGQRIRFQIAFTEDCTWNATIFGKAIVD